MICDKKKQLQGYLRNRRYQCNAQLPSHLNLITTIPDTPICSRKTFTKTFYYRVHIHYGICIRSTRHDKVIHLVEA